MVKIGLLSDTHNYLHPNIYEHFKNVDKIWHAGDIGNIAITDELTEFKPLRAVYGNIDGGDIRKHHPEYQVFTIENIKVLMIHIGGYPPRYNDRSKALIDYHKPDLFVCGHSHILKVMPDNKRNLLHLNPGSCGRYGQHKVKTIMRFDILENHIDNLEIIELHEKIL